MALVAALGCSQSRSRSPSSDRDSGIRIDAGARDGGRPTDAGGHTRDAGGRMDAGRREDAGVPAGDLLPFAQVGEIDPFDEMMIDPGSARDADLTCAGVRTAPRGGAAGMFTLEVRDFQEDTPRAGLCVEFYGDDVVPAPAGGCRGMVTDALGRVTATDATGSWYAYRIFARPDPVPADSVVDSIQVHELAPAAGGIATAVSVSGSTLALIPTILGFMRVRGSAVVMGTLLDCAGEPVYGLQVRLRRSDGTIIPEGDRNPDPHYRYFDGDFFPSSRQPWSHVDGLFIVANLPPTDGPVLVEVIGRRRGDATNVVLACEQLVLLADGVTIVNIDPLRADGPALCPRAVGPG
jgi:hypothetical protein